MKRVLRSATLLALLAAASAQAQSPVPNSPWGCPPSKPAPIEPAVDAQLVLAEGPQALEPVLVAGPFDQPRSAAFLPNGGMLVAERPGRLKLVTPGARTSEVNGVPPVLYEGHGGLLDIALDPGFAANDTLYLAYLHGDGAASTMRVMKAKLDAAGETLTGQEVIFESTPGARPEQIGGRLALTPDGYLFLSLGDRWAGDPAQDLADDAGKIIRIRTDGTIPDDNPFIATPGARPEIWSLGHRNPQGLALNASSGRLWSDEHGAQGGDELNLVSRGRNYGWPIITYGVDYSGRPIGDGVARPGLEQPVHYWVPISIAPSGLAVEADPSHEIVWISALAGQMLVRLAFGDNCTVSEEHFLKDRLGRLRDVRIDPNGVVHVLTDGPEGMLYRLQPTPKAGDEQIKAGGERVKTHL